MPLRELVDVLVAMLIATLPLPLPLAPPVTVIQDVGLEALHAQPLGLVTATVADSPAATALALLGLIAYVHGAAPCVTV